MTTPPSMNARSPLHVHHHHHPHLHHHHHHHHLCHHHHHHQHEHWLQPQWMQGHIIILDLKHSIMCDAEQKLQLTDTGHFTIATSFLLVSCDSSIAMITWFCSLVSQNVKEYCIDVIVATTVTDVTVRVKKGDVIVTAVTSPAAACPALFLFIFTHPLPAPAPPVTGAQSPTAEK